MKTLNRRTFFASPKWVTVAWVVVVWEIGATIVAGLKRTPENVLPHLYRTIGSVFSP